MPEPRDPAAQNDPRPSDIPPTKEPQIDPPPAEGPRPIDLPPAEDPHPIDLPPAEEPPAEEPPVKDPPAEGALAAVDPSDVGDASEDDTGEDDADEPAPARRRTMLLIAGGLVLVAVGALLGLFAAQLTRPPSDDQVIARVGATSITRGEFLRRYSGTEDPTTLLDELIDAELVIQASGREGVAADNALLDQQVQQLREQQGDDEAFNRFLTANRIPSEAALRDLLSRQQLLQAMVYKHTTVEQARARHILLAGETPEAIAGRKPEAEALLAELQGGADFAAIAREKSDDPGSKPDGGDLGWAPRSAFVPAFDEAIFSMKAGELRLVQSDYGWHIIQLQEAPQLRPLDNERYFETPAVQEAINATFLPWVKSLRAEADKAGQVSVVVPPAQLVPSAEPSPPSAQPLDVTAAPAP